MSEQPLNETFTLRINGEERDIFMSYGLVNELARLIQSPDELAMLTVDHDMRDKVLLALLAERTETGKVVKASEDVFDYAVSIKDVDALMTWALGHVTSFFVQAIWRAKTNLEQVQDMIPQEA